MKTALLVYSTCDQNPCNNNGTCQYHGGNYTCTCLSGFTGKYCEQKQRSKCVLLYNIFAFFNFEHQLHVIHPVFMVFVWTLMCVFVMKVMKERFVALLVRINC